MSLVTPTQENQEELTLTPGAKKIFHAMYLAQQPQVDDETIVRLQVSDLISKMSFYYEKIRNAVHYSEDHLLRKDAIFRILKRQLVIEGSVRAVRPEDSRTVAQHLLIELIRAGYLPNNSLPETKIDEVAAIINKYTTLRELTLSEAASQFNFFSNKNKKTESFENRTEITNWVMGLAASEIEEHIGSDQVTRSVVLAMYRMLEKRIELPQSLPYEHDLPIQIYISIYRSLLKFDEDMLSLILFRYFNSDWDKVSSVSLKKIAIQLPTLKKVIDEQLVHPLSVQLNRVTATYNVYFKILEDVIRENPVEIYESFTEDPKLFERKIKMACTRRYNQARNILWRAAWRSIIYILLTKSVFVFLLEVPAIQFFGETINLVSLGINIGFPALLIFLSAIFIRLPGEDNTRRIITGIEEIVFNEKKRHAIKLRKPRGRHQVMSVIFGLIYTITFFISFGLTVWFLELIHFSWVSVIIFLFFLAFASFFIIRIRRTAKEWIVVDARENIIGFLIDFFSVPIIATGKWLSGKFARLNVFAFILDFIIEAPFKIVVEIAEQWTRYVRERKDEL
jgi:hypothetical protein